MVIDRRYKIKLHHYQVAVFSSNLKAHPGRWLICLRNYASYLQSYGAYEFAYSDAHGASMPSFAKRAFPPSCVPEVSPAWKPGVAISC